MQSTVPWGLTEVIFFQNQREDKFEVLNSLVKLNKVLLGESSKNQSFCSSTKCNGMVF